MNRKSVFPKTEILSVKISWMLSLSQKLLHFGLLSTCELNNNVTVLYSVNSFYIIKLKCAKFVTASKTQNCRVSTQLPGK